MTQHSSFMIGRCRTCQARKSTEPGYGMTSGPTAKDSLGRPQRCLSTLRALPVGGRLPSRRLAQARDGISGNQSRLCILSALQPHPLILLQASLVSFEGRSVGKCSHAQRRTSNGEQARPHQTRPLRQWTLPGPGTVNLTRGDQPGLVQRLPVSLQLPVARPTSGRADLYPIRLRARGVW